MSPSAPRVLACVAMVPVATAIVLSALASSGSVDVLEYRGRWEESIRATPAHVYTADRFNWVAGTVCSENGAPLSGVVVKLCDSRDGVRGEFERVRSTTTRHDGEFRFDDIGYGPRELYFFSAGKAPHRLSNVCASDGVPLEFSNAIRLQSAEAITLPLDAVIPGVDLSGGGYAPYSGSWPDAPRFVEGGKDQIVLEKRVPDGWPLAVFWRTTDQQWLGRAIWLEPIPVMRAPAWVRPHLPLVWPPQHPSVNGVAHLGRRDGSDVSPRGDGPTGELRIRGSSPFGRVRVQSLDGSILSEGWCDAWSEFSVLDAEPGPVLVTAWDRYGRSVGVKGAWCFSGQSRDVEMPIRSPAFIGERHRVMGFVGTSDGLPVVGARVRVSGSLERGEVESDEHGFFDVVVGGPSRGALVRVRLGDRASDVQSVSVLTPRAIRQGVLTKIVEVSRGCIRVHSDPRFEVLRLVSTDRSFSWSTRAAGEAHTLHFTNIAAGSYRLEGVTDGKAPTDLGLVSSSQCKRFSPADSE